MMKNPAFLTALLLASSLAVTPVLAASDPAHDGHGATDLVLSLDDGREWETDPPLRAAMETLRNAVAAVAEDHHDDTMTTAEYGALAAAVESQVDYMVLNCELPPEADAQLHVLLGRVLEGVEQPRRRTRNRRCGGRGGSRSLRRAFRPRRLGTADALSFSCVQRGTARSGQ